jgi:hypothetical protein
MDGKDALVQMDKDFIAALCLLTPDSIHPVPYLPDRDEKTDMAASDSKPEKRVLLLKLRF